MADITHVEVKIVFGHEIDAKIRREMHEIARGIAEAIDAEVTEENMAQVPLMCRHIEMSALGQINDGTCLTVDATGHRQMAHAMVDALFDELESDMRDPEAVKGIRQDEREESDEVPETFEDFFKEHFPSWFQPRDDDDDDKDDFFKKHFPGWSRGARGNRH